MIELAGYGGGWQDRAAVGRIGLAVGRIGLAVGRLGLAFGRIGSALGKTGRRLGKDRAEDLCQSRGGRRVAHPRSLHPDVYLTATDFYLNAKAIIRP